MPIAEVDGVALHYEHSGDGPRLLFLNGSGATLEGSRPLIDVLRRRFEVVAHDQRGLGQTRAGSPPPPWTMADYAADAIGLLDHLGWASCRVVGVSFGGMVAQELAVSVPERIERLALMCTSPGGAGGRSYPLHELRTRSAADQADIGLRILDTRFDAAWLAAHPEDQAIVEQRDAAAAVVKSADVVAGEAAQLEARRGHDVWDRLERITCPTIVAGGRFDGIAPPANSEAIASRIAVSELRIFEGGHLFFAQDRRALRDVIEFLAME